MNGFWENAGIAAKSAELLLQIGDTDGAVNRAYYAMFHAARSTLECINPELVVSKRHSTIIARFAQYVVRWRGLDPALGRSFNVTFDQRLIADYEREKTAEDDAREIVTDMQKFLRDLQPLNTGLDQ